MHALDKAILADIFDHHRTFLPGGRCSKDQVIQHLDKAILLDGLNMEESHLVLSVLPIKADRIFLRPLDKGLSDSKVFSAKFDASGKKVSKLFVLKIGNKEKIENEYRAIEQFVSPHIHGVGEPVYRVGEKSSLIIQELAGLGASSKLVNLKNYIRRSSDPKKVIFRLLDERLGNWYHTKQKTTTKSHNLGELFKWYLSKITDDIYPTEWIELKKWVEGLSGYKWTNIVDTAAHIKMKSIDTVTTIVHGDMHAQNVLIDERDECWPIDFAWCHDEASPILDFTMLECSLKFLAIHQRSDLRSIIKIENLLCTEPFPVINLGAIPYSKEIKNVIGGVLAVRNFAIEKIGISFADYRKALFLMTYVHSTHPLLNLPYVLSSLQILAAIEEETI